MICFLQGVEIVWAAFPLSLPPYFAVRGRDGVIDIKKSFEVQT